MAKSLLVTILDAFSLIIGAVLLFVSFVLLATCGLYLAGAF